MRSQERSGLRRLPAHDAIDDAAMGAMNLFQLRNVVAMDELIGLSDEMLALRAELGDTSQFHLNAAPMPRFVAGDLKYHNLLLGPAGNARLMKAVGDGRVLLNAFAIRRLPEFQDHRAAVRNGTQESLNDELADGFAQRSAADARSTGE